MLQYLVIKYSFITEHLPATASAGYSNVNLFLSAIYNIY